MVIFLTVGGALKDIFVGYEEVLITPIIKKPANIIAFKEGIF